MNRAVLTMQPSVVYKCNGTQQPQEGAPSLFPKQ
uniref:Uncharacterized protein n=1 Tax=Anguilla anguilla TaxID=7936 RepID=A0A0E9S2W1_ANGAN